MHKNYKQKTLMQMIMAAPELPESMAHERDEARYEKTIGLKGSAKTKYVKEKVKYSRDMGSMGD